MLPRHHPVSKYGKVSHMDEKSCRLKTLSSRASHDYRDIKGAWFRVGFSRLRRRRQTGVERREHGSLLVGMKILYLAIEVNEHKGNAGILNHTEEIHLSARQFKRRSLELRNERLVGRMLRYCTA